MKSESEKDTKTLTPKIKQFGSLITGLALESSDMDMAVTNLFLPDREMMISSLDQYAQNLKQWEMIQDCNAISTASIPVIKATVDLALLRKSEMKKSESLKSLHSEKSQVSIDHFGETQNIKDSKELDRSKSTSSNKTSLMTSLRSSRAESPKALQVNVSK